MFKPEAGLWSLEVFDDDVGNTFSDKTKQTITGGYVTLVPTKNTTSSYIKSWDKISTWTINNGLSSRLEIGTVFNISGGYVNPNNNGNEPTGFQKSVFEAGAWSIYTPEPGRTGQCSQSLFNGSGSPVDTWFACFSGKQPPVTVEFDVLVLSNPTGLDFGGYATGGYATGLPPLSGVVGHGIYMDNGTYWDYFEVSKSGIRSANHPEVAVPIDLTSPKKIRIGVNATDTYILTEEGRGVAALAKFNKTCNSPDRQKISFGAPPYSGVGYDLWRNGVAGVAGLTIWDNIKILTGRMALEIPSGLQQTYPAGNYDMYTSAFNPQIPINRWVSAAVGFRHYPEGSTIITAQYSGATGWTDVAGASRDLRYDTSPTSLDLQAAPVQNNGITGSANYAPSNNLRFKITQSSSGRSPSPAIDYIKIQAAGGNSLLEVVPNWKPLTHPVTVQLGIKTGEYLDRDPAPDAYTQFLFNSPSGEKYAFGTLTEESTYRRTVSIVGTGEYIPSGPYGQALQTYAFLSGKAVIGSDAANYFGNTYVYNYFPNPLLDEGFVPVASIPRYVTGAVFGELATSLRLPPAYTGECIITLNKKEVYRPENQARINRINSFLGKSTSSKTDYVQNVLLTNSIVSDYCGIEAAIPAGIASGNLLFNCDLQVSQGSGVILYITGAYIDKRYYLPGEYYRRYRPVSISVSQALPLGIYFGIVAPSGNLTPIEYNIDNITVNSYNTCYLTCNNVSNQNYNIGEKHPLSLTYSENYPLADRSSTYGYLHLYLDSYPVNSTTGILIQSKNAQGQGYTFGINNSGFPVLTMDVTDKAWVTGSNYITVTGPIESISLTGLSRFPLGVWESIGFIQQAYAAHSMGSANLSGMQYGLPLHLATCNKAYITIGGYPVASKDLMTGWITKESNYPISNYAPWCRYIVSGTSTLTIASGIQGSVDGIKVGRAPLADAENILSIEAKRVTPPYFVPDLFLKPGYGNSSVLTNDDKAEGDFIGASIYNLDGPGYSNWDHGSFKNHLLFFGDVVQEKNLSPYTGFGSTRFKENGYALAGYSSAMHRIFNTTDNIGMSGVPSLTTGNNSEVFLGGKVYPRTTGIFLEIVENQDNFNGSGICVGLDGSRKFFVGKRTSDNVYNWYLQSTGTYSLNTWTSVIAKVYVGSARSGAQGSAGAELYINGTYQTGRTVAASTSAGFYYRHKLKTGDPGLGQPVVEDPATSAVVLGRSGDVNLSDVFLGFPTYLYTRLAYGETPVSEPIFEGQPYSISGIASNTASKGGTFNTLIIDGQVFTGQANWYAWNYGQAVIQNGTAPGNKMLSVGSNGYQTSEVPTLDGFQSFDTSLFRETQSYYVAYDDTDVLATFGDTNSPIRMGYIVPDGAVNIARIDSAEFNVPSSINTIDLSDKNPGNLLSYKNGVYTLARGLGTVSGASSSGNFKGINATNFANRADVSFSGAVISKSIAVTSLSIPNKELASNPEAFYCYLLGRGTKYVKVSDYYPHDTGNLNYFTTGTAASRYIHNYSLVRNSITLKTSAGRILTQEEYPWDVIISPHTPEDLNKAALLGVNIAIDGIGYASGYYSGSLKDGEFTAVMVTSKRTLDAKESVWAHYPAYDTSSNLLNLNHREVVNPISLMRENLPHETPLAGRYSVSLDPATQRFNLKVYGFNSGYSGVI